MSSLIDLNFGIAKEDLEWKYHNPLPPWEYDTANWQADNNYKYNKKQINTNFWIGISLHP